MCELYLPRGSPRDAVNHEFALPSNRFQAFSATAQLRCHNEITRSFANGEHHQNNTSKFTLPNDKNNNKVSSDDDEDDDEVDDDNDSSISGLGSDVKYSKNRPTKLDVYLKPRRSK